VQRGGHLVGVTLDGLPDRLVEPPISSVASSRVKSSLQPSSGKHSQAILGPLMGVIQDMYLNDTHERRGHSQILHFLASVRASYLHHNDDARACSLTQQLYRGSGVICRVSAVPSAQSVPPSRRRRPPRGGSLMLLTLLLTIVDPAFHGSRLVCSGLVAVKSSSNPMQLFGVCSAGFEAAPHCSVVGGHTTAQARSSRCSCW
jgi:hypothetical protein